MARPRKNPVPVEAADSESSKLAEKLTDNIVVKLYRATRLHENMSELDYARIAGYAQGAAECLVSYRGIVIEEVGDEN